jgi:WbqC-like protein
MPRTVVISQSMYFPWVGLLEQVRLADCFVHYDDVRFGRGFYNRVQVKTADGPRWMTVPVVGNGRSQTIDETQVDHTVNWQRRHLEMLRHVYARARYRDDMLAIVTNVFDAKPRTLAELSRASLLALADYFGLRQGREFADSRTLGIVGASSERLRDIVLAMRGTAYVTGHGARNYLDHALFERSGIAVEYMAYELRSYPQLHGPFTPFVSALDLVANSGTEGRNVIGSGTAGWQRFVATNAPDDNSDRAVAAG